MPAAKKPDLADAFVRGEVKKEVDTSRGTAVPIGRGADSPGRKKVSFAMRPELHRRLKIAAAVHGREMSEILEEALTQQLEELDRGEE